MGGEVLTIYVGIGGWTFAPWRETFYPADVPKARELHYASRNVTAIEVNGTFYRTQTPSTFAKWRDETPDGFVFALKAPRYTTHRKTLSDAAEGITRFVGSGIAELGDKLGPILWSFPPFRKFDADEMRAFLGALPPAVGDRTLRHVLDVRHESFVVPEFVELARRHKAAIAYSDTEDFGCASDVTADFVYARLKRCVATEETGYTRAALAEWASRARTWESGGAPEDLPRLVSTAAAKARRDVFVFFISGAKERAPAAARELIGLLA